MTNNISQTETNQKLTETEQEFYDALLDEYNDIFENILIINIHKIKKAKKKIQKKIIVK